MWQKEVKNFPLSPEAWKYPGAPLPTHINSRSISLLLEGQLWKWWVVRIPLLWFLNKGGIRSLVSPLNQLCPVARSASLGFIFCSAHPILCYWYILMEFLWKAQNSYGEKRFFMPGFLCEGFGREKGCSSTLLCVVIQPLHLHDSRPYGK